jgi:Ca2+-binding EF-hand superfamily protein
MATVIKEDTSAAWIFKLYDKDKKGYIDRNDLLKASKITGIELSE